MRRFLSFVLLVLVAAACGDDDTASLDSTPASTSSTTTGTLVVDDTTSTTTSPSTTTAAPSSTTTAAEWPGATFSPSPLPDVLIAHDDVYVTRVSSAAVDPADWMSDVLVTAHPIREIRMAADGTILTEELLELGPGLNEVTEVARYAPDGTRTTIEGASQLYDVAVVAGSESMIVDIGADDEWAFGGLAAVSLDGAADPIDLGLAAEAEFGVTNVDWADGLAVVTAWSDLTEWVGYRSAAGAVDLPTPTEGIEYNGPPYVTAATLSSDATTVYWAEGPDWGYDAELNEVGPLPAEWRVKAMPLATGEIVLDFPVSEVVVDTGELTISSLHHTGEHLIINRASVLDGRWVDLRPLVLDFSFEEPDLYELPLLGTATPLPGD